MTHKTEFMTVDFVILEVAQKNLQVFFKKKEKFFVSAKFWWHKLAIQQFALAFTVAFAVCRCELQRLLSNVWKI